MGNGILRTSTNRIEILFDRPASNVQTFRIESSSDIDTWATVDTLPAKQSAPSPGLGESYRNKFYWAFDPDDYSLTFPFYLRGVPVAGGVDQDPTEIFIVFDPNLRAAGSIVVVTGTAPSGAGIGDAQEIVMPYTLNVTVSNTDGVASLKISPHENGPTTTIASGGTLEVTGRYDRLYIYGDAADCDFGLQLVLA